MKKKIAVLSTLIAATGILASPVYAEDSIKVGFSMSSVRDAWSVDVVDNMEKNGQDLGMEIVVTSADADAQKQLSDVESLLVQDVDALIINAQDADAIVPACVRAKEAGIPVIFINGVPDDDSMYDVKVGLVDQGEHGRILGEYLENWLSEDDSRVAKIGYVSGTSAEIVQGRKDGILETCPEAEIVTETICDWATDKAMAAAEDWLQAYPEINVFACMNDEMAIGVIQALQAAGKSFDDYIVLGVDGSPSGQEYIRSGELKATTYQNTDAITRTALEVVQGLLDGKTYEKQVEPENVIALMTIDTIDDIVGKAE